MVCVCLPPFDSSRVFKMVSDAMLRVFAITCVTPYTGDALSLPRRVRNFLGRLLVHQEPDMMLELTCLVSRGPDIKLDLKLPPNCPLITQPPADDTLGQAAMTHYTWGTLVNDASGKRLWEFDKRTYTAPEIQTKARAPLRYPWVPRHAPLFCIPVGYQGTTCSAPLRFPVRHRGRTCSPCALTCLFCAVTCAACAVTCTTCAVTCALCAVTWGACAVTWAACTVTSATCAVTCTLCGVASTFRSRVSKTSCGGFAPGDCRETAGCTP